MKKIIILIFLILLTGCNNYNDIGSIAVISTIAIDKNNGLYNIKINVLSSNQKNEENIYSESCININECFNNLNNKLMKRLYLTHLDLLILGNNFIKEDYDNIMNFFLTQKTSRNAFTTITVDKIDEKLLKYDSKDINNILDFSINGLAKKVTFDEIIKNILNYKLSYIPYIENKEELELKGYKVIYDENKLLNKEESIAVNLIQNNIKSINILLDKNNYKLENCNTTNIINNNININLNCDYIGKKENKDKLNNYLKNIILNYINNNSSNYFDYLIYKFDKNKSNKKIYKIDISLNYIENIGGEIFD